MSNYQIDLRLLANRKEIEVASISSNLNAYEQRSALICITNKYKAIIEALDGLYKLNIEHSCDLCEIVKIYDNI